MEFFLKWRPFGDQENLFSSVACFQDVRLAYSSNICQCNVVLSSDLMALSKSQVTVIFDNCIWVSHVLSSVRSV